jgi:hypothetical protein
MRRCTLLLALLIAGCSYPLDDFSKKVVDGGGVDTSSGDSTIDSTIDSAVGDSADSAVDSTIDTLVDSTIDADAADADADAAVDADADADAADTFDTAPLVCDAPTLACGSPPACALTTLDPLHCGSPGCGIACNVDQMCQGAACTCRPGLTNCSGSCTDIKGDSLHCGSCTGTVCTGGNHCQDGACNSGSVCPSGRTKCTRDCWDLSNDSLHCGTTCTDMVACKSNQICLGGGCKPYAIAYDCTTVAGCDCSKYGLGTPTVACPGFSGATTPICVTGSTCPVDPWR